MKNLSENIKKIRTITGLGILNCKKALLKNKGDIQKSINYLRKKGKSKVRNKFIKKTTQGSIFICHTKCLGVILEINCETDFVSRDTFFKSEGNKIINLCFKKKFVNLKSVQDYFEDTRIKLISILGENINFSNYFMLKGNFIHSYVHGSRIGVLLKSNSKSLKYVKKIAMHIAASNPLYLSPEKIPKNILDKEKKIQLEIANKLNKHKSKQILSRMVEGRMKKFIYEICLNKQNFIMDTKKTVEKYLKEKNFFIKKFIRLEVGQKILI
ncbi:translation elongation factor Ts [Buchnera aphidicola]|uniref:translation elongation factor Ts n=1 Tax=Buchnera aphidicola TaxID=9 RepID=UPI0030EC5C8C